MQGHIYRRIHTTQAGRQTVNWYVVIDLSRDADGKRRHLRDQAGGALCSLL